MIAPLQLAQVSRPGRTDAHPLAQASSRTGSLPGEARPIEASCCQIGAVRRQGAPVSSSCDQANARNAGLATARLLKFAPLLSARRAAPRAGAGSIFGAAASDSSALALRSPVCRAMPRALLSARRARGLRCSSRIAAIRCRTAASPRTPAHARLPTHCSPSTPAPSRRRSGRAPSARLQPRAWGSTCRRTMCSSICCGLSGALARQKQTGRTTNRTLSLGENRVGCGTAGAGSERALARPRGPSEHSHPAARSGSTATLLRKTTRPCGASTPR